MKFLLIIFCAFFLRSQSCDNEYIFLAGPTTTVGCGGFLYAGQYLFKSKKDSSLLIGAILCPDGYGESFFKEDAKYLIIFSKDTVPPQGYNYMNIFDYPADKRPKIKLIEKIEQVK